MAKDPAFLFYPGDWQGGTMHMTHLEKGCYIDLLMLQFNRGKFTEAQAKHMLQSSFDLVWATLQEKFICENGFYWNERLAIEKGKRSKFTESRRNNASKEKEALASEKHMLNHMDNHMENENKDKNKDLIKEEKPKIEKDPKPTLEEFIAYYKSELEKEFPNLLFSIKTKYETWVDAGWKDGNGQKIKNWRLKLKNTIPHLKPVFTNNSENQQPTKISFK
jgi:uncharacterized protein YdaU (DUF1376 family)